MGQQTHSTISRHAAQKIRDDIEPAEEELEGSVGQEVSRTVPANICQVMKLTCDLRDSGCNDESTVCFDALAYRSLSDTGVSSGTPSGFIDLMEAGNHNVMCCIVPQSQFSDDCPCSIYSYFEDVWPQWD